MLIYLEVSKKLPIFAIDKPIIVELKKIAYGYIAYTVNNIY